MGLIARFRGKNVKSRWPVLCLLVFDFIVGHHFFLAGRWVAFRFLFVFGSFVLAHFLIIARFHQVAKPGFFAG